MNNSWVDVVLNLKGSILGTDEFKKEIITRWLDDIRNTGNISTSFMVESAFKLVDKNDKKRKT